MPTAPGIKRTELVWLYSPLDFFEAPYECEAVAYRIAIDAGKVTVSLEMPMDPLSDAIRRESTTEVERLFKVRQLRAHRTFQLDGPVINQIRLDGSKSVAVAVAFAAVGVSVGRADFILRDSSGVVLQDSRADRIREDTVSLNAMTPKLARSPLLGTLIESYGAAVRDPGNELIHLYEIRDALAGHFGGETATRHALRITKKSWNRLGALANDEPLKEGRHRGQHASALRPASEDELREARTIARGWIEAFADQIPK